MLKKISIFIFLITILSSCSGTGSKIKPSITSSNNGSTVLYFTREGGFLGGGILAKIEVDGREIARLGTKENITHNVSSNYKVRISGAGISGLGIGKDTAAGLDDGKNHFYIISIKQGLFSMGFKINETTESGFKQSQ
ncbi:hypothetical protein N8895_03305 [Candidatus Pelagibacter sp.]|nr:hypothetical protein [Candidatus Pelagibacter sp.]